MAGKVHFFRLHGFNRCQHHQSIKSGQYQHLAVSPEQLGMFSGRIPRLASLICKASKIRRVHADEAHNILAAGLPHHGQAAFRPAYGQLGELRVRLTSGTPIQALSATFSPTPTPAFSRLQAGSSARPQTAFVYDSLQIVQILPTLPHH